MGNTVTCVMDYNVFFHSCHQKTHLRIDWFPARCIQAIRKVLYSGQVFVTKIQIRHNVGFNNLLIRILITNNAAFSEGLSSIANIAPLQSPGKDSGGILWKLYVMAWESFRGRSGKPLTPANCSYVCMCVLIYTHIYTKHTHSGRQNETRQKKKKVYTDVQCHIWKLYGQLSSFPTHSNGMYMGVS